MLEPELMQRIQRSGQQHVLQFLNELSETARERYIKQLANTDWDAINGLLQNLTTGKNGIVKNFDDVLPPSHIVRAPVSPSDAVRLEAARQIGVAALRAGKVGAILLAGGQGTRLGFPHPKGMYPIGPVSGKSLFGLFAAQVLALSNCYGRAIPYLIMTSDGTHDETIAFFQQHDYFGLSSENVLFFQQGYAPAIDLRSGKLLLSEKDSLCLSPDGHGGLFSAMAKAGLFDEMRRRGVEYLFSHQVDNPLTRICDPTFVGLHIQYESEVSTRVVAKLNPEEKVGVAANLGGKTCIIEYSDLPPELAADRDADGELKLWAGSTAIHLFNRSFLEHIASSETGLPWHRAIKKIPHINDRGEQTNPDSENGIKFERFIFDTLPLAKLALIVEARRDDEFAPLKNKDGDYSANYVRERMTRVARRLLESAGLEVPVNSIVEIDPGFALSTEDVLARISEIRHLDFDQPVCLSPAVARLPAAVPHEVRADKTVLNRALCDPLVFEPYYRPQVWGGRGLSQHFGRELPLDGPYGEAWEISSQTLHVSRIAEGVHAGVNLNELWANDAGDLRGGCQHHCFPLLVKWLECRELLSLQVHPDDKMAQRVLNEPFGKSEAWVVVATEPSARVYAGLRPGVTREDFLSHLTCGTLTECLHSFVPKPGDCISIPAGTIHAAGGGILVAEVQQSSDATFRIFDWNRPGLNGLPRELHVERAMEAINWNQGPVEPVTPVPIRNELPGVHAEQLVDGNGFRMERYKLKNLMPTPHAGELMIWIVLEGYAELSSSLTGYRRPFVAGSTVLIPASVRLTSWKPANTGESVTLLGVRLQ